MKSRRLRFFTWLKHWAAKKEREAVRHGLHMWGDLKCPHCNTWGFNMPNHQWADKEANTPTLNHDRYKCGQCGQWSTWMDFGPLLQLDDPAFPDQRVRDVKGNLAYDS
uniref:HNH endonuclease n=1 Tax=Pseudomonas phage HRDY3 TaxID=3236930 RepID=A0AB39CE97_9VIRU